MNLSTRLTGVKGVGEKIGEQLELASLRTVGDLINFLPRAYEDFSEVVKIADIAPGKRTIKAHVESVETKRVRRGMTVTTAVLADDSGKLKAVWFNQPYRVTQLRGDKDFYFSGNFEFTYNRYQLTNPSAELTSEVPVSTDRIVPVYKAVKGLKSQIVRKILNEIRSFMMFLPDPLPADIVKKQKLIPYADAVVKLHFPANSHDVELARERLAFDELFGRFRLTSRQLSSLSSSYHSN